MTRPRADIITAALFVGGIALLGCSDSSAYPKTFIAEQGLVRVVFGPKSCEGMLLRPNAVLTTAHCAWRHVQGIDDVVVCGDDQGRAAVISWHVHPEAAADFQMHDLAIGKLDRSLFGCYRPVVIGIAKQNESLTLSSYSLDGLDGRLRFQIAKATVEDIELQGRHIIVDAAPFRFCRGSSGSPLFSDSGEAIAVVSHYYEMPDGCSLHNHVMALAPHARWLADELIALE
jgi:hypothetical protein